MALTAPARLHLDHARLLAAAGCPQQAMKAALQALPMEETTAALQVLAELARSGDHPVLTHIQRALFELNELEQRIEG